MSFKFSDNDLLLFTMHWRQYNYTYLLWLSNSISLRYLIYCFEWNGHHFHNAFLVESYLDDEFNTTGRLLERYCCSQYLLGRTSAYCWLVRSTHRNRKAWNRNMRSRILPKKDRSSQTVQRLQRQSTFRGRSTQKRYTLRLIIRLQFILQTLPYQHPRNHRKSYSATAGTCTITGVFHR